MIGTETNAIEFTGPTHHAVCGYYLSKPALVAIAKEYGVCYIQTRVGNGPVEHHEIELSQRRIDTGSIAEGT